MTRATSNENDTDQPGPPGWPDVALSAARRVGRRSTQGAPQVALAAGAFAGQTEKRMSLIHASIAWVIASSSSALSGASQPGLISVSTVPHVYLTRAKPWPAVCRA